MIYVLHVICTYNSLIFCYNLQVNETNTFLKISKSIFKCMLYGYMTTWPYDIKKLIATTEVIFD